MEFKYYIENYVTARAIAYHEKMKVVGKKGSDDFLVVADKEYSWISDDIELFVCNLCSESDSPHFNESQMDTLDGLIKHFEKYHFNECETT